MIRIQRKEPSNWYKSYVRESIELLQIEKQIDDSVHLYEAARGLWEDKSAELENEDDFANFVVSHEGLDSESRDLDTIFREHFPSLQRRSALITLYSFLEYELHELCELYVRPTTKILSISKI